MERAAQRATDSWRPNYTPGLLIDVLSQPMCERLVSVAEAVGFKRSLIYGEGNAPLDSPEVRGSDSAMLSTEDHREYYALTADLFRKYNAENCRFTVNGLEPLQVIRYRPGACFKMHTDIGAEGSAYRKISLILQLSDPGDYEGGELKVAGDLTISRTQGSGCIFPSWVPHEVLPVTSGLRYSLVAWAVGELFR